MHKGHPFLQSSITSDRIQSHLKSQAYKELWNLVIYITTRTLPRTRGRNQPLWGGHSSGNLIWDGDCLRGDSNPGGREPKALIP